MHLLMFVDVLLRHFLFFCPFFVARHGTIRFLEVASYSNVPFYFLGGPKSLSTPGMNLNLLDAVQDRSLKICEFKVSDIHIVQSLQEDLLRKGSLKECQKSFPPPFELLQRSSPDFLCPPPCIQFLQGMPKFLVILPDKMIWIWSSLFCPASLVLLVLRPFLVDQTFVSFCLGMQIRRPTNQKLERFLN